MLNDERLSMDLKKTLKIEACVYVYLGRRVVFIAYFILFYFVLLVKFFKYSQEYNTNLDIRC